jgi:hypothetical protein
MPVSGSGVMLVEYRVPNGSTKGRPPANGAPSFAVWQTAQSAARVRYSPRSTMLARLEFRRHSGRIRATILSERYLLAACEVGGQRSEHDPCKNDHCRGADRHEAPQCITLCTTVVFDSTHAGFLPARTSRSIGSCLKRIPVAAKTAFARDGAAATVPGSPIPPGASSL